MTATDEEQAIFDRLVAAMVQQGQPGQDDIGNARYRFEMPDGTIRKCPVGWAIPDDLYDAETMEPDEESLAIYACPAVLTTLRSLYSETEVSVMGALQDIHDELVRSDGATFEGESFVRAFVDQCNEWARDNGIKPFVIPRV